MSIRTFYRLRIPHQAWEELRSLARLRGTSASALVRQGVDSTLAAAPWELYDLTGDVRCVAELYLPFEVVRAVRERSARTGEPASLIFRDGIRRVLGLPGDGE